MKHILCYQVLKTIEGEDYLKCVFQVKKEFEVPDRFDFYVNTNNDKSAIVRPVPAIEQILDILHYLFPFPDYRVDLISYYEETT